MKCFHLNWLPQSSWYEYDPKRSCAKYIFVFFWGPNLQKNNSGCDHRPYVVIDDRLLAPISLKALRSKVKFQRYFCWNSVPGHPITILVCICPDNPVVVPWGKFGSEHTVRIWLTAKSNYHWIWNKNIVSDTSHCFWMVWNVGDMKNLRHQSNGSYIIVNSKREYASFSSHIEAIIKWLPFGRRHFQLHSIITRLFSFDSKVTKKNSRGSN